MVETTDATSEVCSQRATNGPSSLFATPAQPQSAPPILSDQKMKDDGENNAKTGRTTAKIGGGRAQTANHSV